MACVCDLLRRSRLATGGQDENPANHSSSCISYHRVKMVQPQVARCILKG